MRAAREGIVALAMVLMVSSAALAANVAPSVDGNAVKAVQADRERLFAVMLIDPGNVDAALKYAKASVLVGDIEAAISTLERVSMFAPDALELRFELAVLYFRLNSYELAGALFREVFDAPALDVSFRTAAERYLKAIDEHTKARRLIGRITFGARYQTNANGGAISDTVDLNGIEFELNDTALADEDINGFISTDLRYTQDLAGQGDHFDVDINAYGALYAGHEELDTGYLNLRAGPVFDLGRFDIPDASFGVYGIASAVMLEGDPYRYTAGAGAVMNADFGPANHTATRIEYRYNHYVNSDLRPAVSEMTGSTVRISSGLRHDFTGTFSLYGSGYGQRKDAAEDFESNREAGFTFGGTWHFDNPFIDQGRKLTFDASAGLTGRWYDGADPVISSDEQFDREAFVRGSLTIPVFESWAFTGTVAYTDILSNYDIATFDNVSATGALSLNF